MGKIQKKLKKKQLECFSVQHFGRLAFSTLTLEERAPKKIKVFFAKTVNCQVVCIETLDLQRLPFLFYRKNHLVIVLMVSTQLLLSSCRTHHGEFFPFPRILPYLHLSLRLLHNFWCFCGKTFGVFVVNHNDSVYFCHIGIFGHVLGTGRERIVPKWGKHRAHFQTKNDHVYMGWNLCFILDLWTSPKGVLTDIVIRVGVVHPAFGRDTNQKKKHGCHGIDTDWSSRIFLIYILSMILGFCSFDLVGFASAGALPFCL